MKEKLWCIFIVADGDSINSNYVGDVTAYDQHDAENNADDIIGTCPAGYHYEAILSEGLEQ